MWLFEGGGAAPDTSPAHPERAKMVGATRRKSTAPSWKHSVESDDDEEESPHVKSRASLLRLLVQRSLSASSLALLFALSLLLFAVHASFNTASGSPLPSSTTVETKQAPGLAASVPPPPPPACNCSSEISGVDLCCKRMVLRAHKMGVFLVHRYFHGIPTEIIHPDRLLEDRNSGAADYRHVVLTRPWYEAIVSGYLYHKSGRECWLDAYGGRRRANKTINWVEELALPLDPPRRGRSLCSYLAEEPEEVGLKAYVDYSVSSLYKGIVPHRKLVEETERDGDRHTLYICFGDLEDKDAFSPTHRRAMEWLYPGRPYAKMKRPFAGNTQGHGTSRDTELRSRLMGLVSTYDHQYFDGIGEMATKWLGCERPETSSAPGSIKEE